MARTLVLRAEDIEDALLAATVLAASLRSTGEQAQIGVVSDDPLHHLLIDTILAPCHRLFDQRAPPPGNYTLIIATAAQRDHGCRVRAVSPDALYIEGVGTIARRPLPTLRRVTDLMDWRYGAADMRRRLMGMVTPPVQTAHLCQDTLCAPAAPAPTHRIAVARDEAFTLPRPTLLHHLRQRGAELIWFSPLHDPAVPEADATLLCAVAPELYAAELASNDTMRRSLRETRQPILALQGAALYLGEGVYDLDGAANPMVGRLPDLWQQLEHPHVGDLVQTEVLGHPLHARVLRTSELIAPPERPIARADQLTVAWEDHGCIASLVQPTRVDWPPTEKSV